MTHYHAVMIDETGCEFGAGVEAATREEAYAKLREDYPESRVDQLESPEDTAKREAEMYESIMREYDGYGYDEPDDDEPEDDFDDCDEDQYDYGWGY